MIDIPNHKEIKIILLLMRYLIFEKGVQIKLLELKALPEELSDL